MWKTELTNWKYCDAPTAPSVSGGATVKPKNGLISAAVEPSKLRTGVGWLDPKCRCTTVSTPLCSTPLILGPSFRAASYPPPVNGFVCGCTSRSGRGDESFLIECITWGGEAPRSAEGPRRKADATTETVKARSPFAKRDCMADLRFKK